ncbi:hypothetical protein FRC18_007552 [Serendipita sp. 400]|nr:hypothetical protein FRC18_007552 [Serendipita sp. 400]
MLDRIRGRRVYLIADRFDDSMSQSLSPTETNYVNVGTLDIRRTNFNLVILEPPPNFDLRELSHQMGFNSFERVTIFGNQYNRSTGDVVLPDTHEFFLCDFFLSSNIVAPGTTHVIYLHTAFSGHNIDASPYMLSSLRELTLCGDSIDLPDNNENEISLPELIATVMFSRAIGHLHCSESALGAHSSSSTRGGDPFSMLHFRLTGQQRQFV